MCAFFFFLYITTVNMFLAKLNLSKQHTPSWAVKRADKERTERKEEKKKEERNQNPQNSRTRKCLLLTEIASRRSRQGSGDDTNNRKGSG